MNKAPGVGGAQPEWTLEGTARIVGGYAWLEERLFETIGGWVQSEPDAQVKLHLDADSHHHAWHASLWRERLPVLAGVDPDSFVRPPSARWAAAFEDLAAATLTVERLAGLYRALLPRLAARYQAQRDSGDGVAAGPAGGPVRRALGLVLADELEDWRRGETLLQGQLARRHDIELAARSQARVELLLSAEEVGGGGRESNPPDGDRPSQPL